MYNRLLTKNRKNFLMKTVIMVLSVLFAVTEVQMAVAQNVTAIYDETDKSIKIINNKDNTIILFQKEQKVKDDYIENKYQVPSEIGKEKKVFPCGFMLSGMKENAVLIKSGGRYYFDNVETKPAKIIYYNLNENEKKINSKESISVTTAGKDTQTKEPSEQTKENIPSQFFENKTNSENRSETPQNESSSSSPAPNNNKKTEEKEKINKKEFSQISKDTKKQTANDDAYYDDYDEDYNEFIDENLSKNESITLPEETAPKNQFLSTRFLIIGIILFLLLIIGTIFYVRVILLNNILEKKERKQKNSGTSGLLIEEPDAIEVISYTVGLDDIKAKLDTVYYEIEMLDLLENSSIRNVYFSRQVILDIYKFFSNFLKYGDKTNETGCFLVGRWEYVPNTEQQIYDISIESVVEPSDDAVYGEYVLNFGAKIGITLDYAIEKLCEQTGNEYVHTAWMHSHPGLGLFLSSQDLNVQSQLAHSQHRGRMLAIVIDSNTPDLETAFFTPKLNGNMNNDTDLQQTLSLETLYQWAIAPPGKSVISNYYSINVEHKTRLFNKVLLSGAAIIDLDMTIIPDRTGLRGYFYGKCREREMIIDDFNEYKKEYPYPIGCLLMVEHLSYLCDLLLHNEYELSVIYCHEDEKLYFFTKNEWNNQIGADEKENAVLFKELKRWTRRKR